MRPRRNVRLIADPGSVQLVAGLFALMIGVICFSIVKLQKLHRAYAGEGPVYGQRVENLERIWGSIYDRNGELVAGNYFEMKVVASRISLEKLGFDQFRQVARVLGMDASKGAYRRLLDTRNQYVTLKVFPYHEFDYTSISQAMRRLNLGSFLIFVPRNERYYPEKRFRSEFLCYASPDRESLKCGIEKQLDAFLSGEQGRRLYERSRVVPLFREKEAVDGADVILTLDASVQVIVEEELERAVRKHRARGGYVVVTRPKTGEILAFAGTYRGKRPVDVLNVAAAFEPGSTAKALVAALALDRGIVAPDTTVDCEHGRWKVERRTIRDHSPYGRLSLPEIIWHSSNIGAAKIGSRMDDELFYTGMRAFGLGQRTGIELPGETPGYFPSLARWDNQTKYSWSFGYGFSVNVVQMTAALNAVVNGGWWVPPHLVRRIKGPDGQVLDAELTRPEARQVLRSVTSARMRDILRGVVTVGTGTRAAVPGLDVGGKTGTTRKLKNGRYTRDYLASFYGFFPATDPEVSVYIMIDEPKDEYYGGDVAAPLFSDIARKIYPLLLDTIGGAEVDLLASASPEPYHGEFRPVQKGLVPFLSGLSMRDAMIAAHQAGYQVRMSGHGTVRWQTPAAGRELPPGSPVTIRGMDR